MISTREHYPPIRPPRAAKVSKDTSDRLITIIAELSVSKKNEDRKKKMSELKNDAEASNARIVKLISSRREELSVTMQNFSSISAKINTCRSTCHDIKMQLSACKTLLDCKRHEIKRLWTESIEHHEVINTLNEIQNLRMVPKNVNDFLETKMFTEATDLVVSSFSLFEKLHAMDALRDLKAQLNSLKETLHEHLLEELDQCLYIPTSEFIRNQEENSYKHEPNSEKINNVLNCINKLQKLHETVEIIKEGCSAKLMAIVRESSVIMCDNLQNTHTSAFSYSHHNHLLSLLNLVIDQFKTVALNHQELLNSLNKIKNESNLTLFFHIADIYSKIQATLELFVSDYIDLHNSAELASISANHTFPKLSADISSYFLRKSISRSKNHPLFKFDGSSYKSYLKEQKKSDEHLGATDPVLICPPSAKNITVIYVALKDFISELEVSLNISDGAHCPLHTFLTDGILLFLNDVNNNINNVLDKASESLETLKPVTNMDDLKAVDAKAPILISTITLNSSLQELQKLITLLPDYSSHLVQLALNTLESYKKLCYSTYKDITFSAESVFSLTWAVDKDISRFFRSLPNWPKKNTDADENSTHEECPELTRLKNKDEIGLLCRNLSDRDSIAASELILDPLKLRNLALMHESMEFFSLHICMFADGLPDIFQPSLVPDKSEGDTCIDDTKENLHINKGHLKDIAKEFDDLAEICLLVLHLEIRAHCFYYLLPLSKQASYINPHNKDYEAPEIKKLNDDLSKIDETLSPYLQQRKIKYIFEGLGELLATILIQSVSNIRKINENGVKVMARNIFSIQQNLAGITLTREVALDRARQYFDLLNHSLEDIFNQIVEEGPQFQEQEYFAVIQLLHNSKEGIIEQDSLENYKGKLRQILDGVAVSV